MIWDEDKIFSFVILTLLMAVGICGCSKEKDYDPEDYVTSWLTGDYGNGQLWDLDVSLNDEPVDDYGYVRFESKELKVSERHGLLKTISNCKSLMAL